MLALKPDVITMDYEMPMMDGITAVRQIMQRCPTPVLMFSSLTHEGARVTDALDAGAVDYLPKNFEDISRNPDKVKQLLCEKVHTVSRSNRRYSTFCSSSVGTPSTSPRGTASALPASTAPRAGSAAATPALAASRSPAPKRKAYKLVAIGTSTGGPVALQRVLTQLPANFPAPIVLIQHMPAAFTKAFADRLTSSAAFASRRPRTAMCCARGLHCWHRRQTDDDRRARRRAHPPGDDRLNYKPCVDVTFGSAAKSFHDKVLAVVLTGMGADGREGARLLKQSGSRVGAG